jgi:hypothetical protein
MVNVKRALANVALVLRCTEPSLVPWVHSAMEALRGGKLKQASNITLGLSLLLEQRQPRISETLGMITEDLNKELDSPR